MRHIIYRFFENRNRNAARTENRDWRENAIQYSKKLALLRLPVIRFMLNAVYLGKSMFPGVVRASILLGVIALTSSCGGNGSTVENSLNQMPDHDHALEHEHETVYPEKIVQNEPVICQGYVESPPNARISVRVPVGGMIREIRALPGQYLPKGALIARLAHPDYIHLQQQYLETKAELGYLEGASQRQETLRSGGATTEKDYTRTKADLEIMKSRLAGMAAELSLLGINVSSLTSENLQSTIAVYSPKAAYVTKVDVSIGQLAGPDHEICELVTLNDLHVETRVYESDRARIEVGQKVLCQVAGLSEPIEGTVLLVGREVSPDSRAVQVHVEPVRSEGLIPGAVVEATIQTKADTMWFIPEAAVQEEGSGLFVILHQEGESGIMVPLKAAIRTAEGYLLEKLPASISAESGLEVVEEEAEGGHSH